MNNCPDGNCGGGGGGGGKGEKTATIRGTSSSAFTRSSSSSSRSSSSGSGHHRHHKDSAYYHHPKYEPVLYTFYASLRPDGCLCIGNQAVCPITVPSLTTVPNINIRSGYGTAHLTINYDPNTKMGLLNFDIRYYKLYSQGGLVPARIVGVEIRGPVNRCGIIANIVIDAKAIYQLATGGESLDTYVTGNATISKQKVQQLLRNQWYIVIRTLQFQIQPFGELSGGIVYKRKKYLHYK